MNRSLVGLPRQSKLTGMLNILLQLKIKQRINKLASFDLDNFECWQVTEAFNKAQLAWVRKQSKGFNLAKEGVESTTMAVDDLQILLIPDRKLKGVDHDNVFTSEKLPVDYLYFSRVEVTADKECCKDIPLTVYLAEVANLNVLLTDELRKPSIEWRETFCTIANDMIQVYSGQDFNIKTCTLAYYRKPKEIRILGCTDPVSERVITKDVECEFKDDITEILIDECVAILAGDIESMTQLSRNKQNAAETS